MPASLRLVIPARCRHAEFKVGAKVVKTDLGIVERIKIGIGDQTKRNDDHIGIVIGWLIGAQLAHHMKCVNGVPLDGEAQVFLFGIPIFVDAGAPPETIRPLMRIKKAILEGANR